MIIRKLGSLVLLSAAGFGMKGIHRNCTCAVQKTALGSHLFAGFEFMLDQWPWWMIGNKTPGSPHPALKYKNLASECQHTFRQNEKKRRKNTPSGTGFGKKNPASLKSQRDAGYDGKKNYFMRTIFRTEVNLSLVIRTK